MKYCYLSENQLYLANDTKTRLLSCQRQEVYSRAIQNIQNAKAWKSSGTGAQFMGTAMPQQEWNAAQKLVFGGLAGYGNALIYTIRIEDFSAVYCKSVDVDTEMEQHILSQQKLFLGAASCKENQLAICAGINPWNLHLSVCELPRGVMRDYTDGDTIETFPCWSVCKDEIYCSTAGYARGANGGIAAVGPRSIAVLNPTAGTFIELYENPEYDYLKPSDDKNGNFYFIRQPYQDKSQRGNLLLDIVLFPVRIVRAIGGLLNYFSIMFGGESLRSGKSGGRERAKQKSNKELFFEGNQLEAEKNLRDNEKNGEQYPGLFPRSRVLVRIAPDGTETILKKGVLDYTILPDGKILCSNGQHILCLDGQNETHLCKAKLATNLTLLDETESPVAE